MYHQENDLNEIWEKTGVWDYKELNLKKKWDVNANKQQSIQLQIDDPKVQKIVIEMLESKKSNYSKNIN